MHLTSGQSAAGSLVGNRRTLQHKAHKLTGLKIWILVVAIVVVMVVVVELQGPETYKSES